MDIIVKQILLPVQFNVLERRGEPDERLNLVGIPLHLGAEGRGGIVRGQGDEHGLFVDERLDAADRFLPRLGDNLFAVLIPRRLNVGIVPVIAGGKQVR